MTNVSSQTRKDLEARVIAKAWADEAFKKALIASPRSALEKECGIKLPASVNVRVVEESPDNLYLVLPQKNLAAESRGLSDLELEGVAGGVGKWGPADPYPQSMETPAGLDAKKNPQSLVTGS